MSLDRHHLQLLTAIADHGQLGAAARSLHLSPSAASHRIREAERRLDVALIEIEGRVARLTPAGRLLASTARVTEQQLTRAEQASRWLHHGQSVDRLRVGVGAFDLLEWHHDLFNSAEALDVHSVDLLSVANGTETTALRNGEIDLVIVASMDPEPDADQATLLAEDRLVAVVPSGFADDHSGPFAATDIADHHYLTFSFEPLEGWELDRFLTPAEAQPRSLRQVDRLSALLAMIGRGHGLSIQPSLAVEGEMTDHDVSTIALAVDLPVRWFALTGSEPDPAATRAVERLRAAAP